MKIALEQPISLPNEVKYYQLWKLQHIFSVYLPLGKFCDTYFINSTIKFYTHWFTASISLKYLLQSISFDSCNKITVVICGSSVQTGQINKR